MANDLITVFGSSGFVGRAIVQALCKEGYRVRAAVRRPHQALRLRVLGDPGQVELIQANLRDSKSLEDACAGAHAVINCVGLLFEKGKQTFTALHVHGAQAAAEAARKMGAARFIQISAIGADERSSAAYARTKAYGEEEVRRAFPGAIVLRPSIIFGEDDSFFNRFGEMAGQAPLLPLIDGGHSRMQPIFVGDVARAVLAALTRADAVGGTYELGGPRIYSFRELMSIVARETQRDVWLAPIPRLVLAPFAAMAELFLRVLPFAPPITVDQLEMLKEDNVVSLSRPDVQSIRALGINDLETVEGIVPAYLWRFRPRGQFGAVSD